MPYQLKGKIVLVTGAAGGIGAGVVDILLREGVQHITVLDICNESDTSDFIKHGVTNNVVKYIKCDITQEERLIQAFDSVIQDKGKIDLVINNAGILNDKTYLREIGVNVTALIASTLKAIEEMRKDKGGVGGTVINVSSIAALCQLPHLPIYWATKSAVMQFSNCIGDEYHYSKTGVRVLTICFGVTNTTLLSKEKMGCFDDTIDKDLKGAFEKFPIQRMESAAGGVVKAYKLGESGSTWLAANDKPVVDITDTVKKAYQILSQVIFV